MPCHWTVPGEWLAAAVASWDLSLPDEPSSLLLGPSSSIDAAASSGSNRNGIYIGSEKPKRDFIARRRQDKHEMLPI